MTQRKRRKSKKSKESAEEEEEDRETQIMRYVEENRESLEDIPSDADTCLERATQYLTVVAVLAEFKKEVEAERAANFTAKAAKYYSALENAPGKTITEQKLAVEADPSYTPHREAVELCDSKISWIRAHIDVFNNAHITYRQLGRGE